MSNNFITDILYKKLDINIANELLEKSCLLQYLQKKTLSVKRDSKARGSFANIYAIYVLIEDYLSSGYFGTGKYNENYSGMMYTNAMNRIHELPFGEKIQNHALNNRCNGEFKNLFKKVTKEEPIIILENEDENKSRYYINEKLLYVKLKNGQNYNIANICIIVITEYVRLKIKQFKDFFNKCLYYKEHWHENINESIHFIEEKLDKKVDARIFEVVSYVICKNYYEMQFVYIGTSKENISKINPKLYKMGRTNSNDGGIDFLMIPLGRVFQVTETLNFKKYFLDIDKLNKFPITFIVKSNKTPEEIYKKISEDASKTYSDKNILNKYLKCFDEIITSKTLIKYLYTCIENNLLPQIIDDLIFNCRVEYNINSSWFDF